MSAQAKYRDRVYIREDILLKLMEYRVLNQTALLSYCGLNLQKHKPLLDEMEGKGLIRRLEAQQGKRRVILYEITEKGMEFCRKILLPYEEMFPRFRRGLRRGGEP